MDSRHASVSPYRLERTTSHSSPGRAARAANALERLVSVKKRNWRAGCGDPGAERLREPASRSARRHAGAHCGGPRPQSGPAHGRFSAAYGSLPGGLGGRHQTSWDNSSRLSTESVTFPAGVTTETVVVPINAGAPNPGLVPVQLSVTTSSRRVHGSDATIYLANESRRSAAVDRCRTEGQGRHRRDLQQADEPEGRHEYPQLRDQVFSNAAVQPDAFDRRRVDPDPGQHADNDRSQTCELRRGHEHRHAGSQ